MGLNVADKLIVALDFATLDEAESLIDKLEGTARMYKVGSRLFTASGPRAVELVKERGAKVFLDLKFHDIPNTVAQACEAAAEIGADMLTIHTFGGFEMMESVVKLIWGREKAKRPVVLGVTLLTSLNEAFLRDFIGATERTIEEEVLLLARLAQSAGVDGVVSSPQEVEAVRRQCGDEFIVVTPGVRPAGEETGDQVRVKTPGEAIAGGADYIVVGRPIIMAKDPSAAAKSILEEMEEALK
jgi:orotidine-5'-phosphate decarboxylase